MCETERLKILLGFSVNNKKMAKTPNHQKNKSTMKKVPCLSYPQGISQMIPAKLGGKNSKV